LLVRALVEFEHVKGRDAGGVRLYALSTCVWCRKTRALLDELKVDYFFVYVDLLGGRERGEAVAEMAGFGQGSSFPLVVVGGRKAITGFREKEIREALGA
jgi:glutaredoxin